MSFVVDTDTCSAYMKDHPLVYNRFVQYAGGLYISVVTFAELTIWTRRAKASAKRAQDVQDLLTIVLRWRSRWMRPEASEKCKRP
jgi:predicted nucleic acid-binding protein